MTSNINKYMSLEIINNKDKPILKWEYPVYMKIKKHTNKKGETKESPFFQGNFPVELAEYMGITDNTIYIYESNNKLCVSPNVTVEDSVRIKIQAGRQFSLPKKFFNNVSDGMKCVLKLDFNKSNGYVRSGGIVELYVV